MQGGIIMNIIKRIIAFLFGRAKTKYPSDMFAGDCLVGIVKNQYQLDMNLKHKFYHIPSRFIYELELPVKYVALYTSVKTFGRENAGILYYGKINKVYRTERHNIKSIPKESHEEYFVFTVEKWDHLEAPIKPLEVTSIAAITSIKLLKQSEYAAELYIKTWDEYMLFGYLKKICMTDIKRKKYKFNKTKIITSGNTIEIIFADGEKRRLCRADYKNRPFLLFRKIMLHQSN